MGLNLLSASVQMKTDVKLSRKFSLILDSGLVKINSGPVKMFEP